MALIRVTELDREAQEAVIEIAVHVFAEGKTSRKEYVIKTFCYPFNYPLSDYFITLYGFGVDNILVEDALREPEKTSYGYFSYRVSAEVVDVHKRHVKLGEYDFLLDTPFPKDIVNGMFVSFDVQRIDMNLIKNEAEI